MAEDVQAGGSVHGAGHGAGVDGVADADGGFEVAVRDARFRLLVDQVEDGGACCFGAGAGGRGDGDERFELRGYGVAFAEGRVDEVEEVCFGEGGVEVHQFGGVDYAATADGEEGVRVVGLGEVDCFLYPAQRLS